MLFERSTNQPLFPVVFFPLTTRNTFDFSCYRLMKSCGFLHGCTSRRAKFCSLLSQFLGYFSSFLWLSFALHHKRHGIVWYYLLSLALTRSNSQHCSVVLSRLLSSHGLLFRELPRYIFVC